MVHQGEQKLFVLLKVFFTFNVLFRRGEEHHAERKTLSFSDLIRESRKGEATSPLRKNDVWDHPVKPDDDIGINPLNPPGVGGLFES